MNKPLPLAIALYFLVCSQASAATNMDVSESQRQALGIETQVVGSAATANSRLPARVEVPPAQIRILAAPVAGLVDMLAVVPGEQVRRGQVLARLKSPQALELQRDVLQAAAQATLWRQNLQRDEQLFAEGLIAESRLQGTRAAASQAFAQQAERSRGLQLAGGAPGKLGDSLALVATIDGVVLEQGAQLGQRVEAATPIYRLASLSPLWLEIQVPMSVAATLRRGMSLKVVNPTLNGKLVAIGRSVDPLSQSVLVRGEIHAGAEQLIPGQLLEVELDNQAGQGIQLPSSAVVRHAGSALVFVASAAPGTFAARTVNIVGQGGNMVRVDGVRAGEVVVVKGASGLKAMLGESGGQ
jgi:membrane fusion protein, heavy metal efflux system